MSEGSYQETINKSELMRAIKACIHGQVNVIVAKHSHGDTRMRIGPCSDMTAEQFERYLNRKVANVRRSPAYVWQ